MTGVVWGYSWVTSFFHCFVDWRVFLEILRFMSNHKSIISSLPPSHQAFTLYCSTDKLN